MINEMAIGKRIKYREKKKKKTLTRNDELDREEAISRRVDFAECRRKILKKQQKGHWINESSRNTKEFSHNKST